MKKLFILSLIFLSFSHVVSQNYNWITPNKPYLKLYVISDGIFRINKSDFTSAGINTNIIDPRTVKVYNKGIEIPLYFEGEQDGFFDDTDFLDFYGMRNYGGLTNTYRDSSGYTVIHYTTNEYYDLYSDTNVYWIGWDGLNGLRFSVQNNPPSQLSAFNYKFDSRHFEKDNFYILGETYNPLTDFRHFNTEKVSGEGWFQNTLSPSTGYIVSETFSTPQLQSGPVTCLLKIFAYPGSRDSSLNEHKLAVKINSNTIATLMRDDYRRFDTTISFSSSLLSSSSQNTITFQYAPTFSNQNATPVLYFDMSDVQYPVKYQFDSNRIRFTQPQTDTLLYNFKIKGFNVAQPVFIYDVKNNIKIASFTVTNDTLSFTGKGDGVYEVVNKYIDKKPLKISARQVPDFTSASNTAEYMIIYNRQFQNAAENLRQHRQSIDNFISYKAAIDDITDVFNFGIENPSALRRFIDYVYTNWQYPQLKYICLLGRGSLDPKNNLNSQYHRNLIPVYGNPPSDGYFSTNNFGGFIYYNKIAIGRIPAYTEQEANDMVNKMISYDNLRTNPERWWKTFIMITGGPNRVQQIQYQGQSDLFIQSYIVPSPLSSDAHRIYRNDSLGYITFNYKDSIINEFNRGSSFVNFIGHAANQDWEIGLEDPNLLSNGYKLPLVFSMTCYTGKNAETFRGFGEKFLYLNNKGAIGFIGSTGWSFAGQGNTLNGLLFEGIKQDSLRRAGDILKYASNRMKQDSLNFSVRNTLNCYNLLGDPASKILLPVYPEFVIQQQDYKIANPFPVIGENNVLTIFPKNYGLYAPSCLTRFEIYKNGYIHSYHDTLLTGFGMFDTVSFSFSFDSVANYYLKVILDYNDTYPEEIAQNNIILISVPVRNISFTPLKPVHNSVVRQNSVELVGLNPQVNPGQNSIRLLLQADTVNTFTNPLHTFSTNNISGVVTKDIWQLPSTNTNIVYYWRTNSIINNDSSGWSPVHKFTYNNLVPDSRSVPGDSNVSIYLHKPGQYETYEISNLIHNGIGYVLSNFTGNLQAHSYGSNGFQASYFIINASQIYADNGGNTGLNLAKVTKASGRLVQFKNFRMNSALSSDSVLNFLNTFDTSLYLMVFIASYVPNSDSLKQTAKNKFRQFGSLYADSVRTFGEFDTWAFIGFLGASQQQVSEEFHNYPTAGCPDNWCPSDALLNPVFLNTSGNLTFISGTSHRWKYFAWEQELFQNSSIKTDVYGIGRDEQSNLLYQNLTSNNYSSLDTLNSYTFPKLRFFKKLEMDSLTGIASPVYKSFLMKYTAPAEMIPDNFSISKSDSIIEEGKDVTVTLRLYNVGFVSANVYLNKWTAYTYNGPVLLKADTSFVPLEPDSSRINQITFNTNGLRDRTKSSDTIGIFYQTLLLGNNNDFFEYNNFAYTTLVITGDTLGPRIDILVDGQKVYNGEYVRSKPEINFRFYDNSPIAYSITDTAFIRVKLDSTDIFYSIGNNQNPLITFEAVNQGDLKTSVKFLPVLSEGNHRFTFFGKDKDNNSITQVLDIQVSYALKVRNLYNYPNPMRYDTYFTFELIGENMPSNCRIKIYTVAGRLIKELFFPAHIGFNQIYWDGRDNDGEQIANGIYLYKLIVEDAGKTESSIQKLAILK